MIQNGKIRQFLGLAIHELANLGIVKDHDGKMIKIPSKYAVFSTIGYIKGKSAIAVARYFICRKWNFNGEQF